MRLFDIDHQGKERFFFLAEMRHARGPKEAEKRFDGTARIVVPVRGPTEPPGCYQGVVVVVREWYQRLNRRIAGT